MIAAAFMLMRSPEGRVLLLRRAQGEDHAGGKLKPGETAERAVVREVLEETGFNPGHSGKWFCRRVRDAVDAVTFAFGCDEFVPRLNREHDAWQWIDPQDALRMGAL